MRTALKLAADSTLIGLRVDMSPGGTSLELRARRPDGSFEPLLWIRQFRQDWQTPYVLRSPVALPRDSVLVATASFDTPARAPAPPRLRITMTAAPQAARRTSD